MEKTQEEKAGKCESILKIGVYCYRVSIESGNIAGTISVIEENLIIIGNNKEQLEEQTEWRQEDQEGYADFYDYTLVYSAEFHIHEVMKRFNLSESKINKILGGENLELDDWDLSGTDYFNECQLSMEEIEEKRKIDSEPFDADEIISKIASEYVLTPKRKSALVKSIEKYGDVYKEPEKLEATKEHYSDTYDKIREFKKCLAGLIIMDMDESKLSNDIVESLRNNPTVIVMSKYEEICGLFGINFSDLSNLWELGND